MVRDRKLTLNCTVKRDPDLIAAEVDKDLVMVSISSGFYYGVTDVARVIWDAMEHPKPVSSIVSELMTVYDIDKRTCEEQTIDFLEKLLAENLLKVVDDRYS